MPLEFGLWRIDGDLTAVEWGSMDLESRLEGILDRDINVAAPNWMVVGRQVLTDHGGVIDLLAIDADGNLVVIELKRDKTPRDIVAQTLDYGSWVRELGDDEIVKLFASYLKTYHPERDSISINDAFQERFHHAIPDELNESHELVILAASLDPSTERIVKYLSAEYGAKINALFFRVFKDGEREYLARAWLREPVDAEVSSPGEPLEWNGEFYVSFGGNPNRSWKDAEKYGFISAGGGPTFSGPLANLSQGDRIWVYVPGKGYVGVGMVEQEAVPIDDFLVKDIQGAPEPVIPNRLLDMPIDAAKLTRAVDNPDEAEYVVAVKWLKTVPLAKAIKEKGFFANQVTVCQPKSKEWPYTIERLKPRFGVT